MRVVFRIPSLSALLLFLCSLAAPSVAVAQEDEWMLVHGETEQYGQLSWERIGEAYLGRWGWGRVAAADWSGQVDGPLLIVGNLSDNPVAAKLAGDALQRQGEQWLYHGRALEPGYGLVLGTRVGNHPVCIFTGLDDGGVYQCFTTQVDLTARRSLIVKEGLVYQNWAWPMVDSDAMQARVPLVHDPVTQVLTLLRPWESDDDAAALHARTERAGRLLGGFANERQLLGVDLSLPNAEGQRQALLDLQTRDRARLNALQDWAQGQDLAAMVAEEFARVEAAFGTALQSAPTVFLLLDSPYATNARLADFDAVSGRPRVVMNLACFPTERSFRLALAHEFVHVLQLSGDGRLVQDPALLEGVAAFLSSKLFDSVTPAEALMWPEESVEAAQRVAEQAAKDFKLVGAQHPELLSSWFTLGQEPRTAEGATGYPDRMGYYLGWHAARGWWMVQDQPRAAGLLRMKAGVLLDFMPDKFTIRER